MSDGNCDQKTKCDVWQGLHELVYDVKESNPSRSVWSCVCGYQEDSLEEGGGC